MRVTNSISNICLFLCGFLLIAGCDQTFEPLQENERFYFSIYGYLDAAADTQWVRVGRARESINEVPDPEGIEVTLEHVRSGETIFMKDSLFTAGGFLNYWTTYDIQNEQTYRITVERDGKSSQATVTTPKEVPDPVIEEGSSFMRGGIYTIYIDDSITHLADVQTKWYVLLQPEGKREKVIYSFSHRNTAKRTTAYDGAFFVDVYPREIINHIEQRNAGNDINLVYRQVYVAAAGPEWDENIPTINELEYFLNSTVSNVENGLGYVVGIDSKWVKLEPCEALDKSRLIPCEGEERYW